MSDVLVTGSQGFVGRNLCAELSRREGLQLHRYDVDHPPSDLRKALATADIIFHLAGVNRPPTPEDYQRGNAGFTEQICHDLAAMGRKPKIVLSSSIQAELDNPYGQSKRSAEQALEHYCQKTGAAGVVYRLKNLFGKWCRPNYNSVTATFCHNIANDLPIQISNPANVVDLTYIDDVVAAFLREPEPRTTQGGFRFAEALPSHQTTLGELAALIQSFRDHRKTLRVPDFSQPFVRRCTQRFYPI